MVSKQFYQKKRIYTISIILIILSMVLFYYYNQKNKNSEEYIAVVAIMAEVNKVYEKDDSFWLTCIFDRNNMYDATVKTLKMENEAIYNEIKSRNFSECAGITVKIIIPYEELGVLELDSDNTLEKVMEKIYLENYFDKYIIVIDVR